LLQILRKSTDISAPQNTLEESDIRGLITDMVIITDVPDDPPEKKKTRIKVKSRKKVEPENITEIEPNEPEEVPEVDTSHKKVRTKVRSRKIKNPDESENIIMDEPIAETELKIVCRGNFFRICCQICQTYLKNLLKIFFIKPILFPKIPILSRKRKKFNNQNFSRQFII